MNGAYERAGVARTAAEAPSPGAGAQPARRSTPGKPSRVVPLPGHYASVLRLDDGTGLALSTDTVGTKMVVAERLGRYDTIGIDCVAMNVNDVICVGAEPIAMLDFILTERADPGICEQLGVGLAQGAELAGIEIPGGEIAQVGDIVSGHELGGTCVGAGGPGRDRHGGRRPSRATRSSACPPRGSTRTATRLPAVPWRTCSLDDQRLGPPARRGAARADGDLRPGHPRAAALAGWTCVGSRTSPATASTTCCGWRQQVGLRDRRPASGAPGVRPDPASWATSPTRRCTRSSTWDAAFAAWSPPADEGPALELLRAHYPGRQADRPGDAEPDRVDAGEVVRQPRMPW